MSQPIARLGAPASTGNANGPAGADPAKPAQPDDRTAKLRRAASEFEAIFVKQLLKEAKVGGDSTSKSGGYGDMAIDALANGVQHGGGLGLAKQIERALGDHGQGSRATPPKR